jgi:hypothetical protein
MFKREEDEICATAGFWAALQPCEPALEPLHVARRHEPVPAVIPEVDDTIAVKRPVPIIGLDGLPRASWRLTADAAYTLNGYQWRKEPIGCYVCGQQEGAPDATLSTHNALQHKVYLCAVHGTLEEIVYAQTKVYTVQIGPVTRQGELVEEERLLFPTSMSPDDLDAYITKLLDDTEAAELAAGASPPDDRGGT